MKIYNTKFKALGYEYAPEESYNGYDEYVKHEDGTIKRIAFIYGEDDEDKIIVHEKRRDRFGSWGDEGTAELTDKELDAINSFCKEKKFGSNIRWSEKDGVYIIGGGV